MCRTLDMTVSFFSQEKKLVDKICEKVCLTLKGFLSTEQPCKMKDRWPELDDYDAQWPVCSILKLALQYGAKALHHATVKDTNKHLHSVLDS